MSNESIDLLDTIQEIQDDFENDDHNDIPIVRIQNNLETIDDILVNVLNAPKKLANKSIFQRNDRLRSHVFADLQRVRQFRENLHSDVLPNDLYYFLLDICDDFNINDSILFRPRREIAVRDVAEYFDEKFEVERHDSDFYSTWKENINKANCYVIGFPISEMRNPMNFCLIAHECLHTAKSPNSENTELWKYFQNEYASDDITCIDQDHREETILDLISLNYLGPIYALRVTQLPERLGYRTSHRHMSLDARIDYSIKYLEYIEGESEWWSSRHPLFEEIRQNVLEKLKNRRYEHEDEQDKELLSEFDTLQDSIESYLNDENIPTYLRQVQKLKEYLGMRSAGDTKVHDKINRFVLDEERNKNIALPVKPILLLNLLVLYDWQQVTELRDPTLLSFKKWYVTKKTNYE